MDKKEYLCPNCKQWTEVKIIEYAGATSSVLGFPMPNILLVCKKCGVVFDKDIAQKRDNR